MAYSTVESGILLVLQAYAATSDVCRLIIQQGSDQAEQLLVLRATPSTEEGSDLDVIDIAARG